MRKSIFAVPLILLVIIGVVVAVYLLKFSRFAAPSRLTGCGVMTPEYLDRIEEATGYHPVNAQKCYVNNGFVVRMDFESGQEAIKVREIMKGSGGLAPSSTQNVYQTEPDEGKTIVFKNEVTSLYIFTLDVYDVSKAVNISTDYLGDTIKF